MGDMNVPTTTRRNLGDRLFELVAGRSATAVPYGNRRPRKIAVILPIPCRGGSFRGFKTVAKMLRIGSRLAGDAVDVVAAFPASSYDERNDFADLVAAGVQLRAYDWRTIDRTTLKRAIGFASDTMPDLGGYVQSLVPDDGINHLLDCDFWLVVSDRLSLPLAPLRHTGFVIYDYIQRIRPDVMPAGFDDQSFVFNVQHADFVLCTTPFTAEAATAYAGVEPARVNVVDMEIEVDLDEHAVGGQARDRGNPYILWPSNTSPHKNQLGALDALEFYYSRNAGSLDIILSGLNTNWFDLDAKKIHEHDDPWIKSVRDRIARSPLLRNHVNVVGALTEADYFATLAGARFLFHPAVVDNGTYAVTEAAWFGVPSLCHDYPAIRWMDERFGLALSYCDARDAMQTARALAEMEVMAPLRKALLPSREALRRHGWRNRAAGFWRTVSELIRRGK
jgi:glycosyltransferase involved in cell wall biosynthesis